MQTGVSEGANYTLSGTVKATKAGTYTAKATLKTNANYKASAAKIVTFKVRVK